MPFPHPIAIVATRDGRFFILQRDLVYVTNAGETITIPAGTTSDGASTPQAMWNVLPPTGDWFLAAVLHDFLYRYTDRPKEECDLLFREAMLGLGVDGRIAEMMYQGVHIGGWKAFREDRDR